MNNRKYEILAPAGSYETFIGVLNAGADAVYLGGRMFGARAYAGNLSDDEIISAINYCHIHNKKLYLTVNTLLKNNEIFNELYDYLKPLYIAGLDGVIVQDYGVMSFIHDNFPKMEIHASTQMTITDMGYADFLKKYNVTRIVPARELSLDDIKILKDNTDFEIECFVHGALCYSYSGMCYMSSFIGGRSGNRGRCAQPCRLTYSNGNILSLKDLCTLDILPDILDAGVFSLKIEGRMKSPEYAAGVTSIYRKYVDMYMEKGREGYFVSKEDKDRLLLLFDRGGNTNGYYVCHNDKEMLANENKSDKSLTDKDNFEKTIKEKYLNCRLKKPLNIYLELIKGKNAYIKVVDEVGNEGTATMDVITEAMKQPAILSDVRKQICKLGATDYEASNVEIILDEDVFVPVKLLNELRRCAIDNLNEKILGEYRRECSKKEYAFNVSKEEDSLIIARVYDVNQARGAIKGGAGRICIEAELATYDILKDIVQYCRKVEAECFLCMPRVFLNEYKGIYTEPDLIKKLNFDGFYIRNMAELGYLTNNEIKGIRIADYTVYGFNDLSIEVLRNQGFDEIVYPVELNNKELKHLNNPKGELIVYGRLPLMVSANCIDKNTKGCHKPRASFGSFKDRKNARLPYVTACQYCYNVIFNSVPLFLLDKTSELSAIKASRYTLSFTEEGEAEVILITKALSDSLSGKTINVPDNYTRGHFSRGVE